MVVTQAKYRHRNNNRQDEIKALTSKGIIPMEHELEKVPSHHDPSIAPELTISYSTLSWLGRRNDG
jgi:hypothetical protein